jgi:hypothetical protein
MLTRLARRAVAAVTIALALAVLPQAAALAGGGPGGPQGFGYTQCGQAGQPSCIITAGTSPATGTPPSGTSTTSPGTAPAALSSGGAAAPGCPGTMSKSFGCVPKGCSITVQTLACPIGIGGAAPAKGKAPALPAPAVLAELAVRYLRLPGPAIDSSPAPAALQLTQLPVWLWVPAAGWQPQSKTASVPGESVTATAVPVRAVWSTGDGATVTCRGPGTPYTAGASPAAASPTCGHTYTQSSAGQPGGAYRVTVTVTWDIAWAGPGGAGGVLAPLQTAGAAQFRVAESQALNTSSGG